MQRALTLIVALGACHSAGSSERAVPSANSLAFSTLRVSPGELLITATRAGARATIDIERPLTPPGPLDPKQGYLPDADLGPIYVYMLRDRSDQLISVGGLSYRRPQAWQDRLSIVPTRTGEQLDADLQVVIDTVSSLRADPRGTQGYERELADMLRTAKELKGLRAPTDSIRCDTMDPPTCDPQ